MLSLVQGWTERIRYTLYGDGSIVDLTDMTVELVAYDVNGVLVTMAGQVGIETPASGLVYFDPGATDLMRSKSPYSVRWKVTDSATKVAFFPNNNPEKWNVAKP